MNTTKGNTAIIVLIVAIVTIILGGAYFVYQSSNNKSTTVTNNSANISQKSQKSILPTPTVAAQLENIPEYRLAVVDGINQKRVELGLKKIDADNNLCALAKILAEEKAVNYPTDVKQDIFSDPKYKGYITGYSGVEQLKFTINDIFVKAAKEKGQEISFTDDYITQAYNGMDNSVGSPLQSELTNGCVAVSPTNVGYKPFVFFVGGVKKN